MTYDVKVRGTLPQPMLSIRDTVPITDLVAFFDAACAEMYAYLAWLDVCPAGPPLSLRHSAPAQIQGASDIETCVPGERQVPSHGRMRAGVLPGGELAYTVHEGAYDTMGAAFDAVWRWIQDNGGQMAGPPRDVVLAGPGDVADPALYRTEVALPVR